MRTKTKGISAFPTIRQEARFGNTVSEYELRQMLARGELPGFYTGDLKKYFRINHKQLVELLDKKSACMKNTE